MAKVDCKGVHCPIRNQCERYVAGKGATIYEGSDDRFINTCSCQKKFIRHGV